MESGKLKIAEFEAMAMLDLHDDELMAIEKRFAELVKSFDELEHVQTLDIKPLVSVLDIRNILREDITAKIVSREELLRNAPEQYDGYFQVPGTLE